MEQNQLIKTMAASLAAPVIANAFQKADMNSDDSSSVANIDRIMTTAIKMAQQICDKADDMQKNTESGNDDES